MNMPSDFAIVIPARGGSKRIPRKNTADLGGKPLIAYTFEQVKNAGFADLSFVSSEDTEIIKLSKSAGINVIERPKELAQDSSSTEGALMHVIGVLAGKNIEPEWIITLSPTNPFRKPDTIVKFVKEMRSAAKDIDCVMSVTETLGDYWRMESGGEIKRLFPDAPRSQRLRKESGYALYEENSAIYCTRVSALKKCCSEGMIAPIAGRKTYGISIDPLESFDINISDDLFLAECMVSSLS